MADEQREQRGDGLARVSAEWQAQLLRHALEHAAEGLAHIQEASVALQAALGGSDASPVAPDAGSPEGEHRALLRIGDVELVDGADGVELRPATPAR